jgi:hypothetical protein
MRVKKTGHVWNTKTKKTSYSKYVIEFIDFKGNKHIIQLYYNNIIFYNPIVDYTHTVNLPSKKGSIKLEKWKRIHRKRSELKL